MRAILLLLMWMGLALIPVMANAQTAHPRVIAGFDHITTHQVDDVLVAFCRVNKCDAQALGEYHGIYVWNLVVNNTSPVSVGNGGCQMAGIHYVFCVDVWGDVGRTFMDPARTRQLKAMLEAKGAKVTLMDCSFEWGGHDSYVCANGKPVP